MRNLITYTTGISAILTLLVSTYLMTFTNHTLIGGTLLTAGGINLIIYTRRITLERIQKHPNT